MIYQYCAAFTDHQHCWKINHQTNNPSTISRWCRIFRDDWKHWVSWWMTHSFQLKPSPWWFVCILHVNHKAQRGHHTMWHRRLASVHTVSRPHTLSSFCQNWQIVAAFSSPAWTLCDLTSKYDTSENQAWMFLPPKVLQYRPTGMLKLLPAWF